MKKVKKTIKKSVYADITFILDRSGSMESVKDDTIGGFNNFIEEQKKVKGKADFTLIQFDDQYEVVYENKDIDDVPKLSKDTFIPRGMTALYDAIGKTIARKDNKKKYDQRFLVIQTDGQENSSKEYTHDAIKKSIEELKKDNWQVIFLGAELNSVAIGQSIGINIQNIMPYANNKQGNTAMYSTVACNMATMRLSGLSGKDFSSSNYFWIYRN